jgi:glutamate--cysteine ligase
VIDGRDPAFELMRHGEPVLLSKWGAELIAQLKPLAEILDDKHQTKDYSSALASMEQRMLDSSLTPSAKILAAMKENGQSFTQFANEQADKINQQYVGDLNPVRADFWCNAAKDSWSKQYEIEESDLVRFNQYLEDYQVKM